MNVVLILMGLLILILFPFITLKKIKEVKIQNTAESKKRNMLFLICAMPIPILGFIMLFIGIKASI